jgi:cation:H+ antiporter
MLINLLLLVLGLFLLIKGANWLIDGASSLARKYQISDLAIGLTIVAFGTSAPELVVNAFASYENHQDLVFGNVIGSNNFNLFVILGIAGLITPLIVQSSTAKKEIPLSFLALLVMYVLTNDFLVDEQILSRMDGVILILFFILFLYYVYRNLKTDTTVVSVAPKSYSTGKLAILIIAGLAGLVIGGKLMVDNAVEIAASLGVSEKIIGLTIIAAGTSLPELATTVVAALKKNNDIAVGNIIGSNIFNIFFILGVSALIRPIPYNTVFNTDIYLLGLGTIFLLLAMYTGQRKKLDRWEAGILLVVYISYIVYLIMGEN